MLILLAVILALTGAYFSLYQPVVFIQAADLHFRFIDFFSWIDYDFVLAAYIVTGIAVLATLCALGLVFRKTRKLSVWGLASCAALYLLAILFALTRQDLQKSTLVRTIFASWPSTFLVWAGCFAGAAVLALLKKAPKPEPEDLPEEDAELPPQPEPQPEPKPVSTQELLMQADLALTGFNFTEAGHLFSLVLNREPQNSKAYLGLLMAELNVRSVDELGMARISLAEHKLFQHAMLFADDELRLTLRKCLEANNNNSPVQS